jgi:D-alanine-D-alanine ligase-like ATP-grasp enzyme
VTIDQIVSTLNKNANNAFEFINKISQTEKIFCDEKTKNLSKDSTITDLDIIKKSTKQKLKHILKI